MQNQVKPRAAALRRMLFVALALGALLGTTPVRGQYTTVSDPAKIPAYYLTIDDVINSTDFLPAPPDSLSDLWAGDKARYQWGKTMRDTPRGLQAQHDAHLGGRGIAKAFSEAFGMTISWEHTPAIYYLINHMLEDAGDLSTRHAKKHYMRPRPFMVFGEHTPLLDQENALRRNGSYPSGHSAIGYAVALVLSEINPARSFHIMRRGYELGESRVILGFHFDSDVRMGRLCGSMVVPLLHANPDFQRDLSAAKAEFARLSIAEAE